MVQPPITANELRKGFRSARNKLQMIDRISRVAFCGLLVFLAGCSSLPSIDRAWINKILYTPTPVPPTSTPSPVPSQAAQSLTQGAEQAATEPVILRLWLPPQFNPNANNPAAALLKKRLNDFEADHPGLQIDVRIKSDSDDANLLDSLAITNLAAPNAMPDLIALPRHPLESAAQKGLIQPLDLSSQLQSPELYPYARELSEIDGTPYGLPFAGDALVMIYRPELVWIKTWDDILLSNSQLIFAGADPQGETLLSLYASAGGELTDAQGKPALDQDILIKVLQLFSKGRGVSLFPDAIKNISTDEQVLQEYRNQRAEIGILHFSNAHATQDQLYQPLMGLGEEPHFTFSDGWMWALTGRTPERQRLTMDLATYLTADEFLTSWVQAAGYLPTHRLNTGGQPDETSLDVIQASQPVPSADVVSVLSPLLQEAVTRVLNGEQPDVVARTTIEKLP
jgi:multiple sugar transport system substrate-binding protein